MEKNRLFPTLPHLAEILFYILGFLTLLSSSFNIEQRLPIMKIGPKGSYFGLSIAQHHINANTKNLDDAVLLVGAPTDGRAKEHDIDVVNPGGLYKCDVSQKQDCERVIVTPVNTQRSNSSNQWLGVAVKSHKPGGKIVVCAHRYTIRGGNSRTVAYEAMVGRCFLLENTVEPPLDKLLYDYTPCVGKTDPKTGFYSLDWFGYCQAGTAVDFADDPTNTRTEEFIVFGAPGSLAWSGAFYASQLNPELFPVHMWTREVPDDDQIIQRNSLLGSSLASGVLLGDTWNYVSGAPGANLTIGAVVIFEKKIVENDDKLEIMEIIYGDRVASRFGHEVWLVDVTGDGRLDLIVGAPQYYDREEKKGGAVYIYVNKDLGTIGPEPTQKLFGNIDSNFGMSITKLGDINMDGADDIAIGAPGEDGWQGAVYIYHGNNADGSIGVHGEPSQVIRASELVSKGYLKQNISGMGYSLTGGLDMDFNGYPDIAAGSLSDSVVMFQSRPIVNIAGTIRGPDKKIIITDDTKSNEAYKIRVCLKYTAIPASFDDEVVAMYTVKLDTARIDTDLLPRASLSLDAQSETMKTFNMTLYPQSRDETKCEKLKVYINKDIQDKLSPIVLELSFTTPDTMPKRSRRAISVSSPSPIMNMAIENTAFAEIKFSKACGDDEICKSQLALNAYYEVLRDQKWGTLLKNDADVPVLKLGTEKQIGMMVHIQNRFPGEDAHQAVLLIDLPQELSYRGFEEIGSLGSDLHCDPDQENKTHVLCNIGNPFRSNSSVQFRLKFTKDKSIFESSGFEVKIQMQTTSQQPDHDKIRSYPVIVQVEAQLEIQGYSSQDQVKFGGKIVGESAVKKPADAGRIHSHTYDVENTGTAPASNVVLHIKWPQAISNGKWLFYLLEAKVRNEKGNCTLPAEVNPLKLKYVTGNRKKREAETVDDDPGSEPVTKEVAKKAPESSYEELNCGSTASCIEFNCSLGTLAPGGKIYIDLHAVLWNSTFLEEYRGVSEIQVRSSARVSIAQENIKFSDLSRLNSTVSTSVLSEVIIAPTPGVNWWIIVGASAAGVVLLVLLVFILWKCGFFKRRKFGDYQKARRHKQASKKADERETLY